MCVCGGGGVCLLIVQYSRLPSAVFTCVAWSRSCISRCVCVCECVCVCVLVCLCHMRSVVSFMYKQVLMCVSVYVSVCARARAWICACVYI